MGNDILTMGIAVSSNDVVTASKNLDGLAVSGAKAETATGRLSSSFGGMTGYIKAASAALSAMGIGMFIRQCAESALQMERLNKLFSAAAGNANLAAREMAYIKDVTNKLGLDLRSTTESYGKFMASIRNTTMEGEKGRKVFESVAAASTALGLTAETTNRIFIAMQQMMSKGKVAAEELNGQLGESLPGALDMASRAMGVSRAELLKMMQDGKLMADELLPRLAVELDNTYGKAATEGANSAQASFNRFKNELFETASAIGTALLPALQSISSFLTPILSKVREFIAGFQILAVRAAAYVDRKGATAYGIVSQADQQRKLQIIAEAERAAIDDIMKKNMPSSTGYTAAEKARQSAIKSASPATSSKSSDAAEKAANAVEQWRKTYADLQIEIDKLNPTMDEHAQKIAAIINKYDELAEKKGANIEKLHALRIALIAATLAQHEATKAAEAHKMAMDDIQTTLDGNKSTLDLMDSLQPGADTAKIKAQAQAISDLVATFSKNIPGMAEKGDAAIQALASQYADNIVNTLKVSQHQAAELMDQISKNTVDEANLKAQGSAGTGFDFSAIDDQLAAEKAAIKAKYDAEQTAIMDQIDLLQGKSTAELAMVEAVHAATMAAINEENNLKIAGIKDDEERSKEYKRYNKEKLEINKIYNKDMEASTRKSTAMISALEKALNISVRKEGQENLSVEEKATKSKISMVANYAGTAAQLFSAMADAQDKSSRAGFESAKDYNTAAAAMSMAAGIIGAFAGNGTMYEKLANAAIVLATGMAQISAIQSTTFGGGSTSASIPSGTTAGAGANGGGVAGSSIGARYVSLEDSQTTESMQRLADAADNASMAIGKIVDGFSKIDSMFSEGGYASMFAGNAYGIDKVKEASASQYTSQNMSLFTSGTGLVANMLFGTGNKFRYTNSAMVFGGNSSNVTAQDVDEYSKRGGFFSSSKVKYVIKDDPEWAQFAQGLVTTIGTSVQRMAITMGTKAATDNIELPAAGIMTMGKTGEAISEEIQNWLEDVAAVLAGTIPELEAFSFAGENYYLALTRLNDALVSTNQSFELLGITLIKSTLEGANSAYKLQDLMGGSESFTETMDKYFTSMFTDAQQSAMTAAQDTRKLTAAFAEMGIAVPKTRTEFISLVNGLDMTSDSGAKTFAALMNVSEAFAAAQDAADAMAKDLKDSSDDLVTRILKVEGKDEEADMFSLKVQQQAEITDYLEKGLDISQLLIVQQMEYAAAIKKTNVFITQLTPAMDALNKSVSTAKAAAQTKYDAEMASINEQKTAYQTAYNLQHSYAQSSVSSATELYNKFKSALDGMASTETGSMMSYKSAQATIRKYAASGQLSGGEDMDNALKAASSPDKGLFATAEDYRRNTAVTANDVKILRDRAGSQASAAEMQLSAIEAGNAAALAEYDARAKAAKEYLDNENKRLDAILTSAQAQIDAINGTTIAVMSVTDAVWNMNYLIQQIGIGQQIPGFAVGSSYVPYDMTANIHQGEMIMDRASSDALRKYGIQVKGSSDNSKEIVDELKALRAENRAQAMEIAKANKKMAEILDKWDNDQMPLTPTVAG